IYQQLNSNEAAIIMQLQTGKMFLNKYLYKIKAVDTAVCEYRYKELIAHFLFSCRRAKLRQQHGQRFSELSYALGGYSNRPIQHWKLDIEAVRATIEFTKSTGRLQPKVQDKVSRDEGEADERRQLRVSSSAS
ncbi:hypothetical protein CC78DRAFT_477029, partial [Lojkania enalia]